MEKVHMHPRKLARSMARSQLDKAKVTGYNKEHIGVNGKMMPSLFSAKWTELALKAVSVMSPKRKKVRK